MTIRRWQFRLAATVLAFASWWATLEWDFMSAPGQLTLCPPLVIATMVWAGVRRDWGATAVLVAGAAAAAIKLAAPGDASPEDSAYYTAVVVFLTVSTFVTSIVVGGVADAVTRAVRSGSRPRRTTLSASRHMGL